MKKTKPWQNFYEKNFDISQKVYTTKIALPGPESLPKDKWVLPNDEAIKNFHSEVLRWLETHKLKYHICDIMINDKECFVLLFKRTKDAILFKLVWG